MTMAYLVQHGEKERLPGDPGLTQAGREQAIRVGQWLRDQGIRALYSSPMRRAEETADGIASVTGLAVQTDARLTERLNWDGRESYDATTPCPRTCCRRASRPAPSRPSMTCTS